MIIRIIYPNTDKSCKEYFEVEENSFSLGDIVVVENEQVNMRYGVVIKVGVNTNAHTNKKSLKVASQLDRILFWLDFEKNILHNNLKLSDKVLEIYRGIGKNHKLSDEELTNKIKRNLLLVHHPYRIRVGKNGNLIFSYGSLRITYGNGNIYNLINNCEIPRGWRKDWHKHWYYSKILGVEL